MFTTLATPHGPRFWLPLVAAVSLSAFAIGIATGSGLLPASAAGGGVDHVQTAGAAVAGSTNARASEVRPRSLSREQWEALYGPTAATWGVWRVPPHSLSGGQWEALYGPTAATWGVWRVPPHSLSGGQWEALYGPTAATWGVWKVSKR
jgi:hypothetical protein